ncbi:MAG: Uma2 family endonuclease [Hyphomonadaceae bacterium]|nr:Uma2 family endonuclease [Hyphomonadaceae bacterium]
MNVQRSITMSFEDYLAWEETQAEKHELVGGRPVLRRLRLMAGGTEFHAQIAANLVRAIGNRLAGGPCRVFGSDFKIRSPTGNARYPDVMIKCSEADGKSLFTTEPRVLMEVLSASNASPLDQFRLLQDYKAFASVEYIVFLAQEQPQAVVWTRQDDDWAQAEFDGLEETLELPSLAVSLPFAEIYDGVAFEPPAEE